MLYLFTFIFCAFLSFSIEKSNFLSKRNFTLFLPFIVLAVLAGGRSTNIGTDIRFYVQSVWERNLFYYDFNDFCKNHVLEVGYEFIAYAISRLSRDIHSFFFITHFIIFLLIFWGLQLYCKKFKLSFSICFLYYVLSFYNYSLNIVRQSLAVSTIFLFSYFLFNKKYLIYFLGCFAALFFHDSGIIGFCIGILYFMYSINPKRLSNVYNFFLVSLVIFSFFCISDIVVQLVSLNILPLRFLDNWNDYQTQTSSIVYALLELPFSILSLLVLIKQKSCSKLNILYYFPIFTFFLAIVNMKYGFAHRFLYYFQIFNIVIIPLGINRLFNKRLQRLFVNFCFIMFILVKWFYSVVYIEISDTYPYEWSWELLY